MFIYIVSTCKVELMYTLYLQCVQLRYYILFYYKIKAHDLLYCD